MVPLIIYSNSIELELWNINMKCPIQNSMALMDIWQTESQLSYLPRAGRAPRADGQINVYLHVRTLIHELS
jgi:hypothetical protein